MGVYGKTRVFQNILYTEKESKVFQLTQCSNVWFFCCIIYPPPPGSFNSSPLKNGGWKTILSYFEGNFSGVNSLLNFGRVVNLFHRFFSATWKVQGLLLRTFTEDTWHCWSFLGYNEQITMVFLAFLWRCWVLGISGMSHGVSLVQVNDSNHQWKPLTKNIMSWPTFHGS